MCSGDVLGCSEGVRKVLWELQLLVSFSTFSGMFCDVLGVFWLCSVGALGRQGRVWGCSGSVLGRFSVGSVNALGLGGSGTVL